MKLRWRSHNFIFQSPSVWFWLGGPPRNTQAHPQIRPCSSDRVRSSPGSSSLALPQYLMVAVPWVSWQSLLPRGSSPHAPQTNFPCRDTDRQIQNYSTWAAFLPPDKRHCANLLDADAKHDKHPKWLIIGMFTLPVFVPWSAAYAQL